jgi:hypothetical protein
MVKVVEHRRKANRVNRKLSDICDFRIHHSRNMEAAEPPLSFIFQRYGIDIQVLNDHQMVACHGVTIKALALKC